MYVLTFRYLFYVVINYVFIDSMVVHSSQPVKAGFFRPSFLFSLLLSLRCATPIDCETHGDQWEEKYVYARIFHSF